MKEDNDSLEADVDARRDPTNFGREEKVQQPQDQPEMPRKKSSPRKDGAKNESFSDDSTIAEMSFGSDSSEEGDGMSRDDDKVWKTLTERGDRLKNAMDEIAEVTKMVLNNTDLWKEISTEITSARKQLAKVREVLNSSTPPSDQEDEDDEDRNHQNETCNERKTT